MYVLGVRAGHRNPWRLGGSVIVVYEGFGRGVLVGCLCSVGNSTVEAYRVVGVFQKSEVAGVGLGPLGNE